MGRLNFTALLVIAGVLLPAQPALASIFLAFTPDPATEADGGAPSPEGCFADPGLARGALTASAEGSSCHSGGWGTNSPQAFAGDAETDPGQSTALFLTPPLGAPLNVGGSAELVVYYVAGASDCSCYGSATGSPTLSYLQYVIADVAADGSVTPIGSGNAFPLLYASAARVRRGTATLEIPAYTVPAGHRLRIGLGSTKMPEGRLLYGGAPLTSTNVSGAQASYADAGLTLAGGGGAGSFGLATLPILLLGLLRRYLRFFACATLATLPVQGHAANAAFAFGLNATGPTVPASSKCFQQTGPATGPLGPASSGTDCGDGLAGFLDPTTGVEFPATATPQTSGAALFTTQALAAALDIGGTADLTLYYADETGNTQVPRRVYYHLDELTGAGTVRHIDAGVAFDNIGATQYARIAYPGHRNVVSLVLPQFIVAAGSRVRLLLGMDRQYSADGHLLYGGNRYRDSGITFAVDTTPDALGFPGQADVPLSSMITSAPITVTGLDRAVEVTVSSGSEWSRGCTEIFDGEEGAIANNERVCVRHTSAASPGTTRTTTLTVGGVAGTFASTTRPRDTRPDSFVFQRQDGVTPGATVTSNPVTIAGIDDTTAVHASGGAYSIGCAGSFTTSDGTIAAGQAICVRHTASPDFDAPTTTTLTVGGVSASFTSTTASAPVTHDSVPEPFSFPARPDVERDALVTSAAVVVTGIDAPAPVSVAGGEYSVGCTADFTSAAGSIEPDQAICVRHRSSPDYEATTLTTLSIGGVAGTFSSTTLPAPDATASASAAADGGGGSLSATTLLLMLSGFARRRRASGQPRVRANSFM